MTADERRLLLLVAKKVLTMGFGPAHADRSAISELIKRIENERPAEALANNN